MNKEFIGSRKQQQQQQQQKHEIDINETKIDKIKTAKIEIEHGVMVIIDEKNKTK